MSDLQNSEQGSQGQTVIVNQLPEKKSNGVGTAGFILAIIGFFLGWIPYLGWLVWALGLILSAIGVFKQPRGLAIAGLIISVAVIILIVFVFSYLMALLGLAMFA